MNGRLGLGVLVGLLAAGLVAVAILLGLDAGGSDSAPRELESGEPISVVTTISPPVHRLGDLVVARLDVTVDTRAVDPRHIDVGVQFAPYELARDVEVSRVDAGPLSELRYVYRLQCVVIDCLGDESSTEIELPDAMVSYLRRDPNLVVELPTTWPTAILVARAGDQAENVPAEAILGELPEPIYAVDPTVLRGLLIGLAALLLLAAAAWALVALRPRWSPRVPASQPAAESDSLGRALARLRDARGDSAASQRLALEALAVELDSVNGHAFAPVARRLAWSSGTPDELELDALVAAAQELEADS